MPDVVFVGGGLILEVGCSLDEYMEQALADKLLKYQPQLGQPRV
jgi:hypothetical protein